MKKERKGERKSGRDKKERRRGKGKKEDTRKRQKSKGRETRIMKRVRGRSKGEMMGEGVRKKIYKKRLKNGTQRHNCEGRENMLIIVSQKGMLIRSLSM